MKTSLFMTSCALLVAFIAFVAVPAFAHSFPETETPSAGQTLSAPPSEVTIKYDAPIEKLFAKLEVIGPDGQNVVQGKPVVSDDGYTLSVKVPPLKPGNYQVKWGVVGIDTHHTQGSYAFTVAGGY